MRTAVPLERKSTALNSSSSPTKTTRVENIGSSSCQIDPGTGEPFQNGTALQTTGLGSKEEAINRAHGTDGTTQSDGTSTTLPS